MKNPEFLKFINVGAEKLGAKSMSCSDDFFAEKENLLKEGRGVFIADKYTDRGKWMDGWESRRKRIEGHDWCIVKLAETSIIKGVDVDTNHFLGNHPPYCSIEACNSRSGDSESSEWFEILPKSPLDPGSQHFFEILNDSQWTHVKLHIYPDGGVARLKIYGEVKKNWEQVSNNELIDLAAAINGGKSINCNDMFFSHMDNLIMPGKGRNMGDGWETKRNRTPENRDWVMIKLAHKGLVKKIVVDTKHFKGNYPDTCSIDGCFAPNTDPQEQDWFSLLDRVKLGPDQEHIFEREILTDKMLTHIRLNIFPDGGISRLRVLGNIIR
tara:strand:+ start:489 stop:1463 length:975 start_codon:yes stop_codon:yes gene_type:complete